MTAGADSPAYSLLGWFYLVALPGWLGLEQQALDVGLWEITKAVLVFLGIPLLAGFLTRTIGEKRNGRDWYEGTFLFYPSAATEATS